MKYSLNLELICSFVLLEKLNNSSRIWTVKQNVLELESKPEVIKSKYIFSITTVNPSIQLRVLFSLLHSL